MMTWGIRFGVGVSALVLATRTLLPHVFSSDRAVVHLAAFLLWFVAALQPLNAIVFVLDGVLIGAGDLDYLAVAMCIPLAVFSVVAAVLLATHAGVGWLWAGLGLWMATRAATLVWRWRGDRWLVVGADARSEP